MPKIRVLIAEDSLTIRKRLVEVLTESNEFEVVGDVEDGKAAIELCQSLRPDVVTMDMMMPVMTGVAATEYIMAYCPTPILIVSASTNRGEVFRTYEALAGGAVDVLEKPSGDEIEGEWEKNFLSTLRLVSKIKVITHPKARLKLQNRPSNAVPVLTPGSENRSCRLIAIGASTGGPGAFVDIFGTIPENFRLPILVVLHLGRPFADAFVEWLDGLSRLRVFYAKDGEPIHHGEQGRIILAPPDVHMVVANGRLKLSDAPERHSCRPSVDVLFESVAREYGSQAAGCLLTGMGRDGAEGLLAIRRSGGLTIAQDEATSVVFGMPREAILLGAAERTLPLTQIAGALTALGGSAHQDRR